MRQSWHGMLLVAPCAGVIGALVVYPLMFSIWLSFQNREVFNPASQFVGLAHYRTLLTSAEFWQSFWNGIVFAGSSVLLQIVLGVAFALLAHQSFRGRTLVRGALIFPFIVPTVVGVLVWKWMLNDLYGIVNHWLQGLGMVSGPIQWLSSTGMAMTTVTLINVWLFFPFVVITVLARLQVVPAELYEAARVDGAGAWRQFLHVTLPQIRAVLFIVVLVRGLWMFNKFDSVWLVTEGGPLGATQHLPIYIYQQAFGQLNLGRGAAAATILFGFLAVTSIAYFRIFRPAAEEL